MIKENTRQGLEQKIRQLEAELRQVKNQYLSVIENSMDSILLTSPDGRILSANPAACAMFQMTEQELIDGGRMAVIDPTDPRLPAALKERAETGKFQGELTFKRKDGTKFPVEVSSSMFPDTEGHMRTSMIIRDLTEKKQAEDILKHSLEKYHTLYSQSPIAIELYEKSGLLTDVNNACLELFGVEDKSDLMAFNLFDDPNLDSVYKEKLKQSETVRYQAPFDFELVKSLNLYRTRRSGQIWLDVLIAPLQGEISGFLVQIQDITKQKMAESALRDSENKFRHIFQASPDAITITRLADGCFVEVNDSFCNMTGYSRAELIDNKSVSFNLTNDAELRESSLQQLANSGKIDNFEYPIKHKSGTVSVGLISAQLTTLMDEQHIIAITRDITEIKKAAAERDQLLFAINQAQESIAITGTDGSIQYVNSAFEKITGYSEAEAVGRNPRILKSGMHDNEFYSNLWNTILAGKPWNGHMVNMRKDGTLFDIQSSVSPIKDDNDQIQNFVWIFRDISNLIKLEQRVAQSQKMEAIGSLAGGIAHDFNNILMPVMAMTEIMMDDLSPESPNFESMEQIHNAGIRGRELVKQILAFSRQSVPKKVAVPPQRIVREVMNLFRSALPANIRLSEDIQGDCGLISADPTQLHQIMMNLVTNAYHAIEPSNGEITIGLQEIVLQKEDRYPVDLEPGEYIRLSVCDSGCGIDPEHLSKIFDPYFTTKAQGKGTGLGLAVVYGFVKDHKGDIKVYSEVGKGTTFNVYLPRLKKAGQPEIIQPAETLPTGTENILLVDDEIPITRLGKLMLERLGYQVSTYSSSIEALEVFKASPDAFDLIISDMTMPDMTGDLLTREIRALRPEIPVLICTGFSEKMNDEIARELKINGLVMKPFLRSELARRVRNALDESE
jgi:PAS domain S-box-containing protein